MFMPMFDFGWAIRNPNDKRKTITNRDAFYKWKWWLFKEDNKGQRECIRERLSKAREQDESINYREIYWELKGRLIMNFIILCIFLIFYALLT